MTNHAETAKELFKKGYNCSQAVVGAFAEELGVDFDTAIKMSSSFGGGMGRLREVCGTVSGMLMAAGLKYWDLNADAREAKTKHYEKVQELARRFKEKNGSIICRELLKGIENSTSPIASERTAEYYKKRPCLELVGDAAEILEQYINENSTVKTC